MGKIHEERPWGDYKMDLPNLRAIGHSPGGSGGNGGGLPLQFLSIVPFIGLTGDWPDDSAACVTLSLGFRVAGAYKPTNFASDVQMLRWDEM